MIKNIFIVIILLLLVLPCASVAVEPPDQGEDVDLEASSAVAENAPAGRADYLVAPGLVADFKNRLSPAKESLKSLPPERRGRLSATGSPKILVLLIDFDEYPHKAQDTPEAMYARIFLSGASQFPYESLPAFYRRSSYGKLNISGDVLGWYNAGRRADVAKGMEGREQLIKKVLRNYPKHDFSQYDNDHDGVMDYIVFIWTGPTGRGSSFWRAIHAKFSDEKFESGGKRLRHYAWLYAYEDWKDPQPESMLQPLIHETGHVLGLPDYYDLDPKAGPNGGLGLFDMMDSGAFDHNCFSKFLLGWTKPKVADAGDFKLRPAGEAADCVLVAPANWNKDPFSEFFLVENRRKTGNDTDTHFPGNGGLVVWHVDARLNDDGTDFLYNNSTTEHKLLKLLEADGREHIETAPPPAIIEQDDFYSGDSSLTAETKPSSRRYDGTYTGINLLSKGGNYEAAFSVIRR